MNKGPIGVFDSGVGGLTVFKAVRRLLPNESLVYFGDTAHVPYGSKSKEAVTAFSLGIGRYLAEKEGIKLLIVACNTASALALPQLRKALRIPVLGVIGPGARAAAGATRNKTVAIIATEATIESGAYQKALQGMRTLAIPCPLFVPLVEEGWWSHPVTYAVAEEYLRPLKRTQADTLILGCTHYPLLKRALSRVAGPAVRLIDSAEEVAQEAAQLLRERRLASPSKKGRTKFVVSDGPRRFLRLARSFLGKGIPGISVRRVDG